MTAAYFGDWTGTQTNTITGKVTTPGLLNTWSGVGKFAANQTLQSGTSMLLSKALGQGGSASDALKSALFNTLAAASFNLVGNYTEGVIADGSVPKVAIHAMVGGLLAEATDGDFKTGALAAGANEALVTHLDALVKGNEELLTMSSQIVGVLAAAGQKDADAATLEQGKWIAQNSTQYNYLSHNQLERAAKKIAACTSDACIEDTTRKFKELSIQQDLEAIASCRATPSSCADHSKVVANTMADLDPIKDIVDYGSPKARDAVQSLINSNYEFQEMLATATTEHSVGAMVDSLKAKWGLSDAQAQAITDDLKVALAVGLGTAAGALAYKRAMASAAKETPSKNPNGTSARTDSEAGTLVDRNIVDASAKGVATFPEGMSFNPSIKNHLSGFDGLTQRKGINGTHNLDAFSQAATQNGAKVVSQTPGGVNGISEIKYQIPAYDRAGNVTGYKAEVFTKTVYDPKVFTDSKILDLGQQAAASGYNSAISQGLREYTAAAGGVKFRVYLDGKTVKNFFPEAN
nr:DUF637 domain-containing protein [Pseudomonas khavaziana]